MAELQALKAQLHPHFLFNTLNNIYSYTQDTAPVDANMLMGLSTLLRYMLYSCNTPLVPLKQEINMLLEYIKLEKQRYGNQLEVAVQIPAIDPDLMISPLLILPFIENCFKQGIKALYPKAAHTALIGRMQQRFTSYPFSACQPCRYFVSRDPDATAERIGAGAYPEQST